MTFRSKEKGCLHEAAFSVAGGAWQNQGFHRTVTPLVQTKMKKPKMIDGATANVVNTFFQTALRTIHMTTKEISNGRNGIPKRYRLPTLTYPKIMAERIVAEAAYLNRLPACAIIRSLFNYIHSPIFLNF